MCSYVHTSDWEATLAEQTTNHMALGTYAQPQNMLFYKNLNWPNMIMKAIWLTGQKPELCKLKQMAGTGNRTNWHTLCLTNLVRQSNLEI